ILIEIENSSNEIVTIQRFINPGSSAEEKERMKFATVFENSFSTISANTHTKTLYLRGNNNNENDFGFYNWLAEFIGINLPIVTNSSRKGGYSPLYLQNIFPSMFIEQTKGW